MLNTMTMDNFDFERMDHVLGGIFWVVLQDVV